MASDIPPYEQMSNTMPTQSNQATPKPLGWRGIKGRANLTARSLAIITFFAFAGAGTGYLYALSRQSAAIKTPAVQALSQSEINQLGETASKLGTTGQTLVIAPNAEFKSGLTTTGDLLAGGRLTSIGPASLASLAVTGTTATAGLNVSSSLAVGGSTTLQRNLTVAGLATVGSLNVSGSANVGSLNAPNIIARTISVSGPITISHLASQGPSPTIAAMAAGSGGSVAISGNDTAGVITINTGNGPGTTLAVITFRTSFSGNVHIMLTPRSSDAAGVGAYVTSTPTTFQINARTPLNGLSLSFNYLVIQ